MRYSTPGEALAENQYEDLRESDDIHEQSNTDTGDGNKNTNYSYAQHCPDMPASTLNKSNKGKDAEIKIVGGDYDHLTLSTNQRSQKEGESEYSMMESAYDTCSNKPSKAGKTMTADHSVYDHADVVGKESSSENTDSSLYAGMNRGGQENGIIDDAEYSTAVTKGGHLNAGKDETYDHI